MKKRLFLKKTGASPEGLAPVCNMQMNYCFVIEFFYVVIIFLLKKEKAKLFKLKALFTRGIKTRRDPHRDI